MICLGVGHFNGHSPEVDSELGTCGIGCGILVFRYYQKWNFLPNTEYRRFLKSTEIQIPKVGWELNPSFRYFWNNSEGLCKHFEGICQSFNHLKAFQSISVFFYSIEKKNTEYRSFRENTDTEVPIAQYRNTKYRMTFWPPRPPLGRLFL